MPPEILPVFPFSGLCLVYNLSMNPLDTQRVLDKLSLTGKQRSPNVYDVSACLVRGLQAERIPGQPLHRVPDFPSTHMVLRWEDSEPKVEVLDARYEEGLTEAQYAAKAIEYVRSYKEALDTGKFTVSGIPIGR